MWRPPEPQHLTSIGGSCSATLTPAIDSEAGRLSALRATRPGATATVTGADGTATFTLDNPVAPLTDGCVLITLDDWHAVGHGQVAAAWSPTGERLWAHTLDSLLGEGRARAWAATPSGSLTAMSAPRIRGPVGVSLSQRGQRVPPSPKSVAAG